MTKFKVGDKVRVVGSWARLPKGTEGTVVSEPAGPFMGGNVRVHANGQTGIILGDNLELIESTPPKQTKSQRISALEAEVQRLHERISDLERKPSEDKAPKPALTPNEQRKAIIAEAKAFVEQYYTPNGQRLDFYVNSEKRTAVAVVTWSDTGYVKARGIAKAHPDDVFNADIGKAIALGRALGLDVTRFEKAAQPTEVVVGMVVVKTRNANVGVKQAVISLRDNPSPKRYPGIAFNTNLDGWLAQSQVAIFDDTEAQY